MAARSAFSFCDTSEAAVAIAAAYDPGNTPAAAEDSDSVGLTWLMESRTAGATSWCDSRPALETADIESGPLALLIAFLATTVPSSPLFSSLG